MYVCVYIYMCVCAALGLGKGSCLYNNNNNNNNNKISLLDHIFSPAGLRKAPHIKFSVVALFESTLEEESFHSSLEYNQRITEVQVMGKAVKQLECMRHSRRLHLLHFEQGPENYQFVFRFRTEGYHWPVLHKQLLPDIQVSGHADL